MDYIWIGTARRTGFLPSFYEVYVSEDWTEFVMTYHWQEMDAVFDYDFDPEAFHTLLNEDYMTFDLFADEERVIDGYRVRPSVGYPPHKEVVAWRVGEDNKYPVVDFESEAEALLAADLDAHDDWLKEYVPADKAVAEWFRLRREEA